MSENAVEVIGLGKSFGPVLALHGVNLTVKRNEFVSLLGSSGCGKSTLLRIISGFERPDTGVLRVSGKDIINQPPEKRETNMVFQRGALFPHMNVRENIGYSLKVRGWERQRIDDRVDEMLALVRLEGYGDRSFDALSGGQSQRVALARALASEPKVLLLDEPLSALDLKLRQQMQLELRTIQRKLGATFVFVTHDQTEALVMSDRIAVMQDGRVAQMGTPQEIYQRPSSVFVSDFIGQTNLLKGRVCKIGADSVMVETSSGQFAAPNESQIAEGEAVTLSIRPEALRVLNEGETVGPGCSISGTISEVVYLGRNFSVAVALSDDTIIWADMREAELADRTLGSAIAFTWPASSVNLLKGKQT